MIKLNIVDKIVFSASEISFIVNNLKIQLRNYYKTTDIKKVEVFVVLDGARPFSKDLFSFCSKNYIKNRQNKPVRFRFNYFKVQSYYGTTKSYHKVNIDWLKVNPEERITSKHILIVDDIYDTGITLSAIYDTFKKYDPLSLESCVLINRKVQKDKKENIRFIGTETKEKEFFIGYGLDYDEKYRDLPYIATIHRPDIEKNQDPYYQILCNQCGEDCKVYEGKDDVEGSYAYGLIKAEVTGGYFSPALKDDTFYRFDICEKCLQKMFDQFSIPVTKKYFDIFTGEPTGDRI